MPKSFDEYADEKGIARIGSCAEFFDVHPELIDEILRLRSYPPAKWDDIHAWLVEEYGYTLKDPKGVADYLRRRS